MVSQKINRLERITPIVLLIAFFLGMSLLMTFIAWVTFLFEDKIPNHPLIDFLGTPLGSILVLVPLVAVLGMGCLYLVAYFITGPLETMLTKRWAEHVRLLWYSKEIEESKGH